MIVSNNFSIVAQSVIERVQQISRQFSNEDMPQVAREQLFAELDCHEKTLTIAFEFRRKHGPEMSIADTHDYFGEKLVGMIGFAKMAVDPAKREGYSEEKIIENVGHFSYLVAKLVAANWSSMSRRPKSDKTLKESSFENREALERLVNR